MPPRHDGDSPFAGPGYWCPTNGLPLLWLYRLYPAAFQLGAGQLVKVTQSGLELPGLAAPDALVVAGQLGAKLKGRRVGEGHFDIMAELGNLLPDAIPAEVWSWSSVIWRASTPITRSIGWQKADGHALVGRSAK